MEAMGKLKSSMELTKVPLVPQWNLTSGCACTPNGGFLYVGTRSVNYLGPASASTTDTPPLYKVFHTRQTITSIDVDPRWGAEEAGEGAHKYFAALAQDNSLQIWDFERGCAVSGHKAHASAPVRGYMEGNGPSPPHQSADQVLLSYMRNSNVLTIDAADLVIFCVASNTYVRRPTFVSSRNQQLTVLRASPYNEHRFALGTSRGLVLVCDLQQASIVYTLRGHDVCITSLSWTRAEVPASIAPKEQQNWRKKPPLATSVGPSAAASDDIFDIYDYDYLENEFGGPSTITSVQVADSKRQSFESAIGSGADFVGIEKPKDDFVAAFTKFDFAEACQSLKEEIDALKQSDPAEQCESSAENKGAVVTLADCRASGQDDLSSSCGDDNNDDSTEGSLELINRSSSEDDAAGVDGCLERKPKQQILHQAEVHAVHTLERKNTPAPLLKQDEGTVVEEKEENKSKEQTTLETNPIEAVHVASPTTPSIPPIEGSTNDGEHFSDILLASASIDGTFWVWNTETGAACDNMRARSIQSGKNTHIEITWISGAAFLTSSKMGELSYWSLLPPATGETNPKSHRLKFKEEKRRFIQRGVVSFGVCKERQLLWCITSFREISCENFAADSHQLIAKYCCASSNIAVMRECPDDMNKIALGFSDRRIGIIDISKMSPTNVSIENYTGRIDSPVLSIVWSPDNKKLAFGTIEGRMGVVNVENMKNQPYTFNPVCGKPIYSLAWQGTHIYVVCNDTIAVYEDTMTNRDAHVIAGIFGVSAISLRDNFLFVGTQRGHLQLYRRRHSSVISYELVQVLELAPRYITEIAWSPIASDQLAVVANANNIHLLSFNPAAVPPESPMVTQTRRIEIKNSKAANACVKWSNTCATHLLTCGFDGAVRVWDLENPSNTEKFLKQFSCPMTCGLFLPTDENVVVCAGKATSVEMFDMRIESSADYSQAKWKRQNNNAHALDSVQWAQKAVHSTTREAKITNAAEKRRQRRDNNNSGGGLVAKVEMVENSATPRPLIENGEANLAPCTVAVEDGKTDITDLLTDLKIAENKTEDDDKENTQYAANASKKKEQEKQCIISSVFMRSPTTLLYLATKELNKDALEILTYVLSSPETKRQPKSAFMFTKLFGTKSQAKELLAEEFDNYKHNEVKGISSLFMPQLNSNIKEEILKCVQQKQLSEWHVSLAPTVSYSFWKKCCQAFAEQLIEQGYALQAATYMLAIHNQTEAIEMLLERHFFKEALLLARVYMQSDEPLVTTVVDKWIGHLVFTGNLPGAALLCALSGQINRAYETLAKMRNTQPEVERVLKLLKTNKQYH